MSFLLLFALGLQGIIAGIYVSALIHDHRIADLSAGQYVAMHQMRDKSFRRIMPAIGLVNLGLVVATATFGLESGIARTLAFVAAALLVADIALTISRQLPLNAQVQSWTDATMPADWSQIRDRWAAQHLIRLALVSTAYVCLLTAVFYPGVQQAQTSADRAAGGQALSGDPCIRRTSETTLKETSMPAFAIFDVEIRNANQYQKFMARVKPALEEAGAKYLARGGAHKVYEGDWTPRRLVIIEFPSMAAFEAFYNGPIYQELKTLREESSSARLVAVEGLE